MDSQFKSVAESVGIKVLARLRPLNDSEIELISQQRATISLKTSLNQIYIQDQLNNQSFTFDTVLGPTASQCEIFELIGRPTVSDIFEGYNSTIFAYGATGSGKTFTMMGDLSDSNKGIIPRIAALLSSQCNTCKMTVSCIEIYREQIKDLNGDINVSLKLKESNAGVYIEGVSKLSFDSQEDVLRIFEHAGKLRAVAATKLNRYSSRSHFLIIIEVVQELNKVKLKGRLNLIDLAGSEKVSRSEVSGTNLEEAKKINLSLSALSKVIYALSTNAKHIPYRDSKLTRLLQDSLGGNSKTSLIVNCTMLSCSLEETLSSLRFAQRAKTIKNCLRLNKEVCIEDELKSVKLQLSKTQKELKRLKNHSFSEFNDYRSTEEEEYLKTLEFERISNEKEIIELECGNRELKRRLLEKKENFTSSSLHYKLQSLKLKNEKNINCHLDLKCKKLMQICNILHQSLDPFTPTEEISLIDLNSSGVDYSENRISVPSNATEIELQVFYIQAEQIEKKIKSIIKILNFKIFSVYGKSKINSQSCINQQKELKELECLIEKLRRHIKLIKDEPQHPKPTIKVLESKLEIIRSQSAYWKNRLHYQSMNLKCIQRVFKEIRIQKQIISTAVKTPSIDISNASLSSLNNEISSTSELLLKWINACKSKQELLGINTIEIQDLIDSIQL